MATLCQLAYQMGCDFVLICSTCNHYSAALEAFLLGKIRNCLYVAVDSVSGRRRRVQNPSILPSLKKKFFFFFACTAVFLAVLDSCCCTKVFSQVRRGRAALQLQCEGIFHGDGFLVAGTGSRVSGLPGRCSAGPGYLWHTALGAPLACGSSPGQGSWCALHWQLI